MQLYRSDDAHIHEAAAVLRSGGLIAFPTETVYGLGADATQPDAVARIFQAKGRPADHPLIVHVSSIGAVEPWVASLPAVARQLGTRFWPGPLTLVLPRASRVPDAVTGGQSTVAIRVPDHPVALALLNAFDGPIAAPSANPYGRISPTTAAHVLDLLGNKIDGVIEGGACRVGIESTILDLTQERARVLRQGMITPAMLAETLGYLPETPARSPLRMPGTTHSHYAPETPAILVSSEQLEHSIARLQADGLPLQVLAYSRPWPLSSGVGLHLLAADPDHYARELYACLRAADQARPHVILIETPPAGESWNAIRDRLARATEQKSFP